VKRQKVTSKRHVLLHGTGHSSCPRSFTRRTSSASDARSHDASLAVFNLSRSRNARWIFAGGRGGGGVRFFIIPISA